MIGYEQTVARYIDFRTTNISLRTDAASNDFRGGTSLILTSFSHITNQTKVNHQCRHQPSACHATKAMVCKTCMPWLACFHPAGAHTAAYAWSGASGTTSALPDHPGRIFGRFCDVPTGLGAAGSRKARGPRQQHSFHSSRHRTPREYCQTAATTVKGAGAVRTKDADMRTS